MYIHQITGYSDSGKTTAAVELIKGLTAAGVRTATIKHHGEKSPLTKEPDNKDTLKHRNAGAMAALVSSPSEFVWTVAEAEGFQLKDFIRLYEPFQLDCLIIEGYKKEEYPKTVLVRNEQDTALIDDSSEVKACILKTDAIYDMVKSKYPGPIFFLNDLDAYVNWFITTLMKRDKNDG